VTNVFWDITPYYSHENIAEGICSPKRRFLRVSHDIISSKTFVIYIYIYIYIYISACLYIVTAMQIHSMKCRLLNL
jgi:hypothetical protein